MILFGRQDNVVVFFNFFFFFFSPESEDEELHLAIGLFILLFTYLFFAFQGRTHSIWKFTG